MGFVEAIMLERTTEPTLQAAHKSTIFQDINEVKVPQASFSFSKQAAIVDRINKLGPRNQGMWP
jgi:hypothetical protein